MRKLKSLQKYVRSFRMGFQSALEYRADFLLSIFSGAFVILIQCFIWTAVFAGSKDSVIYGYTFPEMISYSIMAGLVTKFVSTGFEWEIAGDIKNGGLSKFIVQPIGYFYYRIFSFLGRKAVQLSILLLLSAGTLFLCHMLLGLKLELPRLLLFIPFVFLAMALNFLIYYILSTLAFTLNEVWGIFFAAGQGILMLSGGIFPLDLFGRKVSEVLAVLPFEYMVYFPVNIVNGRLPLYETLNGAIVQCIWVAALAVAANLCWRSGMKKYVAAGG